MRGLARYLGEDEHTWAMCGLLHDIDVEQIIPKEKIEQHMKEHCSDKCSEFLSEIDFPQELIRAIQSHNEVQNISRDSKLAKALFAVDGLTGFIVAVSKIYPDKKITSVKVKSVIKKKIIINGKDKESLLYNFLEEFLFLLDAEDFLLSKINKINKIDITSGKLIAEVTGDKASNYKFTNDVKAITYNEMFVKQEKSKGKDKFICQVVVDV